MKPAQLGEPSPWVKRFLSHVEPGSSVLDVACGSGRHLQLAVNHGLHATGVDQDISRASQHFAGTANVTLIEADLETGHPLDGVMPAGRFDTVIVTNYLWRPILPDIIAAVAPEGLLIYETFAIGNEQYGKPSNPDFLFRPGELLEAVTPQLTPFAFEHAQLEKPDRIVQRICAAGPDHKWLRTPPVFEA
ncbi:MAG: class I SAM-dependent methyltransferase [Filomicrobium sp.]